MRRETLFAATKRVREDLKSSGVVEMLDQGFETMRKARPDLAKDASRGWLSLDVFQKYSVLTSNYGEVEDSILEILGLLELKSPALWAELPEKSPPSLSRLRATIAFAIEALPRLLKLIEQDHVREIKTGTQNADPLYLNKKVLSVILVEDHEQLSSPVRLIQTLTAVTDLYVVLATLDGLSTNDLSVLACDSGSDKSFDFLGLAKVMEQLRSLILEIWDRRVFHRHIHISQCVGLIAESLPVIEEIHKLKQSGALGPEQAELLKRKAIEGATKFLECGAIIDEMDNHATQSPRLLMRPEPKLLTAPRTSKPSEPQGTNPSPTVDDNDEMTDKEIEELERLVSKAKGRRPKRKSPKTSDA